MTSPKAHTGAPREPVVGVRELRADLARHLARVGSGETLIISRGGRPVARLGPLNDEVPPEFGLEEMARLGLVVRPRVPAGRATPPRGPNSSVGGATPVDIRIDRIVRLVRG